MQELALTKSYCIPANYLAHRLLNNTQNKGNLVFSGFMSKNVGSSSPDRFVLSFTLPLVASHNKLRQVLMITYWTE